MSTNQAAIYETVWVLGLQTKHHTLDMMCIFKTESDLEQFVAKNPQSANNTHDERMHRQYGCNHWTKKQMPLFTGGSIPSNDPLVPRQATVIPTPGEDAARAECKRC